MTAVLEATQPGPAATTAAAPAATAATAADAPAGRRRLVTRGRVVTAVAAAAILSTTCGTAFAFWTTTGAGAGTAGAASGPALSATTSAVGGLYPGASVALPVTVTNPGARSIALTAVTPGPVTSAVTGCAASVSAAPGTLATVAAGGTTTVAVTVTMALTAPDTCQGASFTVPVTVTGRQQ